MYVYCLQLGGCINNNNNIVRNLLYQQVKINQLETKCVFEHRDKQMFDLKLKKIWGRFKLFKITVYGGTSSQPVGQTKLTRSTTSSE